MRFRSLYCGGLMLIACCAIANAQPPKNTLVTDPAKAGADYFVQGEYAGALDVDGQPVKYGAQIIALGGGKFDLVLYPGGLPGDGWKKGQARHRASGATQKDVTRFASGKFSASVRDGVLKIDKGLTTKAGNVTGQLKRTVRKSPTLGRKPPAGAVVLFDGSDAKHFQRGKLVQGNLLLADCESKAKFGDHSFHLEFRTPFKPFARGQGRGNSGVYLQCRYECQVLDSFGLEGKNNECGGIYSIAEPLVNACLPPLTWQTYDVDFTTARYEGNKKVTNARVTIRHNGILIHDNLELTKGTPGKHAEGPAPDGLYLQGHGNPVVYRNIWVVNKPTKTASVTLPVSDDAAAECGPLAAADKAAEDANWDSIFDGKTLKGWDGNPKFWSVKDGAITGQTTKQNPTKGNTFIIWRGGETGDFELKLEYKIVNGNSGIQYRSFEVPDKKWVVGGYQADFEAGKTYSGILYGERFRGILARRGDKTVIGANHKPKVVGSVGKSADIQAKIKHEDWNEYHVVAQGFHFVHRINGVLTAECTDEDAEMRRKSGILALQLHAGPPMTVQFRNIRIKRTSKTAATKPTAGGKRKVALIAGRKSHGYAAHEHRAGCMLLAKCLNQSGLDVQAQVYTDGWPKDSSVLKDADTIVIYADGGGRHPFIKHLDELDALMKQGAGMVCIHYGVEVPKGAPGNAFLDWTGGFFETHWSVNPHWTADYKRFPKHIITNGVKPFTINDEWYYHMRFRKNMDGVTPILTAVPPASTLSRKDGPHSNNRFVRAEKGQPQHMAWALQRSDGGRGFGFTGGHVHWNWGNNNFRKLVLNAIVWTAKLDVPRGGVASATPTIQDLEANQDYSPPANHNAARLQKMLDDWNRATAAR